jgi:hypothetical protein
MDATNTQTAFTPSFVAEIRARLSRLATPTRRRMEAMRRRAATADRISQILTARADRAQQADRADAAHKFATAARAAREERTSRLFGAVLGMGIAIATAGQIALALATI